MKRIGTWLAASGLIASLAIGTASAQDANEGSEVSAATDRATEFRAVSGAPGESVPGGMLLVGAYGAAWAILFLFVLRLGSLHREASSEIERLRKVIDERSRGA